MTTYKLRAIALLSLLFAGTSHRAIVGGAPVAPDALALDPETVVGPRHFSTGYPTWTGVGAVNAVIEIPAGTTAKFEVDEDSGALRWVHTREDDSRREVDYLPYPANYGMVPRTLAADGDPLDILVLGRGLERGLVAPTRVIGVMITEQDDVRDDKLIAVPLGTSRNGFSDLRDLGELDARYPGAREILELWLTNCWGRGSTDITGWGDVVEARAILEAAALDSPGRALRANRLGSSSEVLVLEQRRHPPGPGVDPVGLTGR